MQKHGALQWYHCLIPSTLLHVAMACFVIFDVLGVDLHIFASEHQFDKPKLETLPIHHWFLVIPVSDDVSVKPPEAVSIDENIFEQEESEEVPLPNLQFSLPETKDDLSSAAPDPSQTNTAPIDDIQPNAPITTNSTDVVGHVVTESSNTVPSEIQTESTSTQHRNNSPTSDAVLSGNSKAAQTQPDLDMIWKNYTKVLSQHFRMHKHYPEMARQLRLTGTVKISVKIDRNGKILSASVVESSGNAILDQAALQSAKSANPVQPFPPEITVMTKDIIIPYHYSLK